MIVINKQEIQDLPFISTFTQPSLKILGKHFFTCVCCYWSLSWCLNWVSIYIQNILSFVIKNYLDPNKSTLCIPLIFLQVSSGTYFNTSVLSCRRYQRIIYFIAKQTFIQKRLYFSNIRIGIGEVMFTFESDL